MSEVRAESALGRLALPWQSDLLRPRLPFLGLAGAAVGGVLIADQWMLAASWLLALFGASVLVALVKPRSCTCLCCAVLAFATLHTVRFRADPDWLLEKRLGGTAHVAEMRGVVWSDPEPLAYFAGKQTGSFRVRANELRVDGDLWPVHTIILTTWAGPLPAYGDLVSIRGTVSALEPRRNPGQFDFSAQLRRSGVFARLESRYSQDCLIEGHGAGNPMAALALRTSEWMRAQLALDLEDSPEIAALIASMVLGLRGDTPADVKDVFRTTGTLHLFAVSGLNIAMLAIIAGYVLRPIGFSRRWVAASTIPVLFFYALVTGLSASCLRAAIMGSLVLLGLLVERPGVVYNSLAAAAVLILAWDTNQLFVPGFQFSFVLVFVIVWLADRISRRLAPLGCPDPFLPESLWTRRQRLMAAVSKALAASMGLTLAAWLGSLAFTAGYFHLFSPTAIFANLIAVPISFCVLTLGVATIGAALVAKPLAIIFSNANWLCAKALLASVRVFALVPGGHVYVELPALHPAGCEVTALDMGEGAAIHVRSGGADWLIDGGSDWRYTNSTLPYLRSRGVNRLDGLICTHGDAQHIGSAIATLGDFAPRTLFDTAARDRSATRRKLHAELASRRQGKAFLRRGDEVEVGGARLRTLFPPVGWQQANADDKALVLMLECQAVRVLMMSDAGLITERWLLDHEPSLRADVIIKGQHSRDFSGTADFVAAVQPKLIIASASLPSRPIDPWLAEMQTQGIEVFNQAACGAATLTVRDGEITVRGFMNDQIFRSRAR